MLKFGDAVIKDNTDWLIYTPDRYVNIRYNTRMPPWYVRVSGPSSAKAGSTVNVTVSEQLYIPISEMWDGKIYLTYYDKDYNSKTVTINGRSFTMPSDVHAMRNEVEVVAGYKSSDTIDYETIIRFDLAEAGKYIYISQCYPYVQSGTHYWWRTEHPDWQSYNYTETAIDGMNANPPIYVAGGGASNLNAIDSYSTDDPSRMYTILNIGDKASTISTGNFSFKYSTHLDVGIVTMRSYRRVNSLITGITDVLVETKSFTPIKNETDVWPYSMYINI